MSSTIVQAIGLTNFNNKQTKGRKKSMKKTASILVLLSVLSFSALADDGTTHSGGKTCPEGQTCLIQPPIQPTTEPTDKDALTEIVDFLKALFG